MPDDAKPPSDAPEPADTAVAPEPDDRAPSEEPDLPPDPKAAGATGWQAVAAPGKPDGEVDTRS